MSGPGRIFSIDETIAEQRPRVELRGALYAVRDMPVQERLKLMVAAARKQEEIERESKRGEDGPVDTDFARLTALTAEAVRAVLDGVPDEVANTITEREFEVLQKAVAAARDLQMEPQEKKKVLQPISG